MEENQEVPVPKHHEYSNPWEWIKSLVVHFLDIRGETDQKATLESIKADISFRGHTSWVLVCSIFVASVGLNANSTAVVIGAMLISPLMGPILGIGLSLAINDVDLLRRSIKNFGAMVFMSILAAFLFFWIFPLREASSELLARTEPDIRDVLIAFFGGLALVIARTKKGTIASVIFGVAIATALMPPLCTVGFGLAIGNFGYAFGALYLFAINTIFIALATFLVLRIIRMPMVVYANSSKRRRISNISYIVATLVMIPAGYTFYQVWRESQFNNSALKFIEENIATYQFKDRGKFLSDLSKYEYNDGKPVLELVFIGDEAIPQSVINTWNSQKEKYLSLKDAELHIVHGAREDDQNDYIRELYETNKEELVSRKSQIEILEKRLAELSEFNKEAIRFKQIAKEASINYDGLKTLGFANEIVTDFKKTDTIPVFETTWKEGISEEEQAKQRDKLKRWLELKLDSKKIQVR